jgi:hypothetical protein
MASLARERPIDAHVGRLGGDSARGAQGQQRRASRTATRGARTNSLGELRFARSQRGCQRGFLRRPVHRLREASVPPELRRRRLPRAIFRLFPSPARGGAYLTRKDTNTRGTKWGSANPHGDWPNPHSGGDWRIPPQKIGGFSNPQKYLLFQRLYLHF